jgi:hypothetical protein
VSEEFHALIYIDCGATDLTKVRLFRSSFWHQHGAADDYQWVSATAITGEKVVEPWWRNPQGEVY